MIDQNQLQYWIDRLDEVKDILFSLDPDPSWTTKQKIRETCDESLKHLEADLDFLHKNALFLFSSEKETDDDIQFLRHCYLSNRFPSLLSLSIFTAENFQIQISQDFARAFIMAGILGEVPNDLPYHSVDHYKKVVFQTIRLIAVHNDIYQGTDTFCDDKDITLLLLAAGIHDLAHDGKGNTVQGVYQQARLERHSYIILLKYFDAIGFQDSGEYRDMMDRLRVMLLCTDTSPMGDLTSFMNQMKTAYRFHFRAQTSTMEGLNLDPEIKILETDAKLTVMCLMLHEADMATSSGLDYKITIFETSLFHREIGQDEARPSNALDFMNIICQRQILSSAGQKLYSANMARILALAERDIKNGNQPFPSPEHSDFLLVHGETQGDETPKTIN